MIITSNENNKYKVILKKTKLFYLVDLHNDLFKLGRSDQRERLDSTRFSVIDYEETRNKSGFFWVKPKEFQHMDEFKQGTEVFVISGHDIYSIEHLGAESHECTMRGRSRTFKSIKLLLRKMSNIEVLMLEPEVMKAPTTDNGISIVIPLK